MQFQPMDRESGFAAGAGSYRARRVLFVLAMLTVASAGLAGCGQEPPAPAGPPPVVAVTTMAVKAADTPIAMEYVAKTASSRRVEIRSRVEGFLEKREYVEGSMVEVGQALFQMDRKPFEARLNLANAELEQQQARLTTAKQNPELLRNNTA